MIYKSYLVENNINIIKENLVLFYGENSGLQDDFKKLLKIQNKNSKVLIYDQDDILKNKNEIFNELLNFSLFEDRKTYFINQTNDKIIDFVEELKNSIQQQTIYFFSDVLDKKSKIRSYFEKEKGCAIVPCYEDNEIGIKKIISERLKGFKGLSQSNINLIVENTNLDRVKLNNEIQKIKTFFKDKIIDDSRLEMLLDLKVNDDFTKLRDAALLGDKTKTNKLLSDTIIDPDKNVYYIATFNQRLDKLRELNNMSDKQNIEAKINSLKPPVFWKDKPCLTLQAKKWSKENLDLAQYKTYELEIRAKSDSAIVKSVLIKKLLVEVCEIANS